MKIAIVCPYDIHRPGGVQAHILDCATHMSGLGHAVRIIAPGPAPEESDDARILHFGASRGITFNETFFELSIARGEQLAALRRMLEREAFDVLHFHTIWTPLLSLQILRLSKAANVATFHDTPPDSFSGRMTKRLFRLASHYLMRKLDRAIAVSESPARHLVPLPGREPVILPPCIDYSPYLAEPAPMPGYDVDKVVLLYLGRLEQRKGVFVLLEAYRRLLRDGAQVRLIVAGAGDDRPRIEAFVETHALPDVDLVGRVREEDKPRWYATADIFCSPAVGGESFGIVLVEAMASGKPVVAARNTGYASVLTGPAAAFLAAPGDAGDLRDKLARLIGDSGRRAELGVWGREEAMRHDVTAVVPKLLAIYERAIEKRLKP